MAGKKMGEKSKGFLRGGPTGRKVGGFQKITKKLNR